MAYEYKFDLFEKETVGEITLNNKVRISDPCYDIDTWCAGTIENVLPGDYKCYMQRVDTGSWGVRISSIEVKHKDYLNIEPTENTGIDVGVDSGQAGIYDLDYFVKNREDKNGDDKWYWRVCDSTYIEERNPNYHNFEKSSFYKPEFNKLFGLTDDDLDIEEFNKLWKEYREAENAHRESDEYFMFKGRYAAALLDNKCLVSSSGNGDGSYTCLIGKNKEGKVVSIKVDYYYGYDEDEEEF